MKKLMFAIVPMCATVAVLSVRPVQSHNPVTTSVRFNREIATLLNARCVHCHQDGGMAMSLQTYAQVRPWAQAIKEEVLARRMPPWPAERGYGAFANDGGLTLREQQFLLSWIDGGVPAGDGAPPAYHDHSGHWMLGQPDTVYTAVPDNQGEQRAGVSRFIVDTAFGEDVSIRAIDLTMPDKRAARAAFVSIADTGQYLGGWTPWRTAVELPDQVAFRLPAGGRIAVDVLHAASASVAEPPRMALYVADNPAHMIERALAVSGEAGAGARRVHVKHSLQTPRTLVGFRVDMSAGGESIELTARRADGAAEPLLWSRNYRQGWQVPYVLRDPVVLPAGSVLQVTAYFDESTQAARRATVYFAAYESAPGVPAKTSAPGHVH